MLASNSSKSRTNSPIDEVAKRFRTDLVIFFDLTREREREREVEASQRSFGLLKGPRVLGCKRQTLDSDIKGDRKESQF